jgi:hypothetical protein
MCYGYSGYSDRWWEDADERRRLEVDRRHQESERLARQAREREFERQRREVLRARQDAQLRRLESEMLETIDVEKDVGEDADQRVKTRHR